MRRVCKSGQTRCSPRSSSTEKVDGVGRLQFPKATIMGEVLEIGSLHSSRTFLRLNVKGIGALEPLCCLSMASATVRGPNCDRIWDHFKTIYGKVHNGISEESTRFQIKGHVDHPHHRCPESLVQVKSE